MKTIRRKITYLAGFGLCLMALWLPLSANAESTFSHKYLSLTLPDGWYEGKIPSSSEQEVIAVLKTKKIKGASIMVMCYRGAFQSRASTRIRGLKTIGAIYPAGQKMMKKPYKVRTNHGRKARVEQWLGYINVGKITVNLFSPMAVMKTRSCWLLMLGITANKNAEALTDGFLQILRTAK